jgi:hypothetical protein
MNVGGTGYQWASGKDAPFPSVTSNNMAFRTWVDPAAPTVVPLPSAAWLLGVGLIGLFRVRRTCRSDRIARTRSKRNPLRFPTRLTGFGSPTRARTWDLRINSPFLCRIPRQAATLHSLKIRLLRDYTCCHLLCKFAHCCEQVSQECPMASNLFDCHSCR